MLGPLYRMDNGCIVGKGLWGKGRYIQGVFKLICLDRWCRRGRDNCIVIVTFSVIFILCFRFVVVKFFWVLIFLVLV
jgi:hypothetical protein